jgi:hypothetical protein
MIKHLIDDSIDETFISMIPIQNILNDYLKNAFNNFVEEEEEDNETDEEE